MHSPDLLFIGNLFGGDMIIILVIALMLFGGEKLPEIARGLGKGLRDFKDASEGIKREILAPDVGASRVRATDVANARQGIEAVTTVLRVRGIKAICNCHAA